MIQCYPILYRFATFDDLLRKPYDNRTKVQKLYVPRQVAYILEHGLLALLAPCRVCYIIYDTLKIYTNVLNTLIY